MRIAHISDTHLSAASASTSLARAERARGLWPELLAAVRADTPDLIIHTGDLVFEDPDRAADRRVARAAVDDLPARVLVLPGNHDLGDHRSVTDARRAAYQQMWGPDRWVEHHGGHRMIGFNSLLLGSGLAAEREQEDWLRDLLATASEPTLVFCHQPLLLTAIGEAESWAVPPTTARERMTRMLAEARADIVLIAAGHIHRHRDDTIDGLRQVTAPSAAFPVPELVRPTGRHETGFLRYELGADAHRITVERRLVTDPR